MKNILLIVTDTFRYDNLLPDGPLGTRTPSLDRFAAERATSVTGFWTGSFPTIPHRTDVTRGVLGWPHYGWQPLAQCGPNHMPKLLGGAGYATQMLGDCPHIYNQGFGKAFDAAYHLRGQEGDQALLHLNDPIEEAMPAEKARAMGNLWRGHTLVDRHRWTNRYWRYETETFPPRTAETAVRWLEENYLASPFFMWLDFFDPHEPWDAPEYLVRRYDADYNGLPMLHPNYGPSSVYSEAELRNLRAHYAAEAELVDRWLGRVLAKLDDLALWDETIVVVTSDHGHSIGEHGRCGKSNIHAEDDRFWPLYPEVGHVPFLIAGGDVPRGQTLDLVAQPIDILPTVAELAEVCLAPEMPFEGRSFAAPVLSGKGGHRDLAVSGSFLGQACEDSPVGRTAAGRVMPFVVQGRWGYAPVGADRPPELYDLAADPLAETNVAGAHPDAVRALNAALVAHLREHDAPEDVAAAFEALA